MSRDSKHTQSLWERKGFFRLSRAEEAFSISFREWLRSSPSDLGAYLADVAGKGPKVRFDREDVATLEKLIVRSQAKRKDAIVPLRILSKVIYQLNSRYQKSIPQPRYVFSLKRETNPFVGGHDLAHKAVRACFALEDNWIENLSPSRNKSIKNGASNIPPELVIFSAVLRGGLLDIDLAVALYEALQDADRSFHFSQTTKRVYADLSVADADGDDQERRRWYPSDKLICLIARAAGTGGASHSGQARKDRRKAIEEIVWLAVEQELNRQRSALPATNDFDDPFFPESLRDLVGKVRTVMHSEIPSFLVEYAARKLDSRSLLPASIGRIYGDPSPIASMDSNVQEEESGLESELSEAFGGDSPEDLEPEWLPDLRKALRGEDLAVIKGRLKALVLASGSEAPQSRFISFALRLAEHGTSWGNPLHPSSLRCCVLTAGRRIGRVIGTDM